MQQEVIHAQLGDDVPLVLEPEKGDTFPAICLASSFLYSKMNSNYDEVIVVMPVDVDADEGFFDAIKQFAVDFEDSEASIGLIGLHPTHPSEKFGYILRSDKQISSNMIKVDRFVEKPSMEEATRLIGEGALWNCGVFVFRLGYMINLLEASGWSTQHEEILQQYHLLPSISFDYQVVERETDIVVKPYSGRWNDLGTWNDWTATMSDRIHGKAIMSDDCNNTHVINELQIPVVAMGLSDAVIVASPDGILVANKPSTPKLKDLVHSIASRPMYEETIYGWYRVIDVDNKYGQQVITKRVHVWSGKHISYHNHMKRTEIWTIISGRAEVVMDDRKFYVAAGDIVSIEAGVKHAIKAIGEVDMIEVQIGESISDDDIARFKYDWNDS